MESNSKQQLLKRISSLVLENKELKNKQRTLTDEYSRVEGELKIYQDLVEKTIVEYNAMSSNSYQQKRFDKVTVMFIRIHRPSDIAVFAADTSEYLEKIDNFQRSFHKIAEKHKLVKLQSIGDQFICAGGIPEKNSISPVTVTLAAFEILGILETERRNSSGHKWSLNIGIHTGAVNALVDGHKRLNYYEMEDDTLKETSHIVSVCTKNNVTISASTYELVKELFECNYTHSLLMKNRKELELFAVAGCKAEYAGNAKIYLPNDAFRTQLMLIQFSDLQEFIFDKLEKELPDYLYYHNVKHTVDVVTQCELIGWSEGLRDNQLLMLKTAALFHDTGHTVSYENHEDRSVDIARNILPKYSYTSEEIDKICRIIMSTKLPPRPTDLFEAIICDSDLDYLGRTDFVPVSNTLYAELKTQNKSLTLNEWNKMQLKFITSHQYFTKTGRKLRNVKKQEQIVRIKELIE